jgi:Rrf2 family protein
LAWLLFCPFRINWFDSHDLFPLREYAVRAFIHLGSLPQGEYALVKHIAADAGMPAPFLAHILQTLVRVGLLESSKGPGGGFRLRLLRPTFRWPG